MKIGILGGIGPEASANFYTKLVKGLKDSGKINNNGDFPEIFINNINAKELVGQNISEQDLIPYLNGIKDLKKHKPNFIVMVCNTIHLYRDYLILNSGYKNILSLRDIVSDNIKLKEEKLCILGTYFTVTSGLYNFNRLEYSNLSNSSLINIGKIVYDFNKSGDTRKGLLELDKILREKENEGNIVFLSACTEISNILSKKKNIFYIDTLDLLLKYTLKNILDKKH